MSATTSSGDGGRARRWTVALLREPPGADHLVVAFLESARFYRLPRAAADFAAAAERLRASRDAGRPVAVAFAVDDEERIVGVGESPPQ